MQFFSIFSSMLILGIAGTSLAAGQQINRSFTAGAGVRIEVINHFGRVEAGVRGEVKVTSDSAGGSVSMTAVSSTVLSEADLKISSSRSLIQIEVSPKDRKRRIDITLVVPEKARLKVETLEGEVRLSGNMATAHVRTQTGTIAADVPTGYVRYSLLWTASRPRYLSDFELARVKEKAAGKFQIEGSYREPGEYSEVSDPANTSSELPENTAPNGKEHRQEPAENKDRDKGKDAAGSNLVTLDLETARGIILLNVPPNGVSSDLRERPLTLAAKAIVRSGDSLLMEAIRRAAPKYYSDYTRTLPPLKLEPRFSERPSAAKTVFSGMKVASVRVSDLHNRAVAGLTADDFEVLESGEKREIVAVRQSAAPFNLVLLLDVSGSVDNYVDFIRKAARNFVNTVDARDRVAIVTFNEDVNLVSKFTTDKAQLSASLDTFDAGGPTAYYDVLAYTLADTLRPLKGERTAIVVLTDGDDNRSFLPFDSMLASIQESGALIYPLYVPSGLIAASRADPNAALDSLRSRYLQGELTSKAKGEGERLAKVSGGVYYEISKLSQIQTAYEDIVRQLRTAYEIEYRSGLGGLDAGVSPRLRIRTKQPNTYVQIRSVEQRIAGK